MAHFAELDASNVVLRVIVFDAPDGPAGEAAVTAWYGGGTWKQTSYNGKIRKNFAGDGYTYDEKRDAFIAPTPDPSWLLDEATCQWYPPKPLPQVPIVV